MKLLLSPAKNLNLETNATVEESSELLFPKEASLLASELKKMDALELEKLMKVSENIAKINQERFQNWKEVPTLEESLQAVFLYKGEVYRNIDAETLDKAALDYLQKNSYIFSGLYGLLRPLDRIMPYRLEMVTKFGVQDRKNLYEYWKELITEKIKSETTEDEILLNLTSNEYIKTLDKRNLGRKIVECQFKTLKDGKLKSVMMHLKAGRGLMAKFCAQNNIKGLEQIKEFNLGEFSFEDELSTQNTFTFVRQ